MSFYNLNLLEELTVSFQRGEEQGYDHFFRLYYRSLRLFASKILGNDSDAEDIVQECFAKLWERRAEVENGEAIRSFLYTTVRNACINKLRPRKLKVVAGDVEEMDIADEITKEQEAAFIRAEMLRQVYESIETLPARIREVFKLFYIEGKSEPEISSLLNTSRNTIRNQRARALVLLKQRLNLSD